MATIQRLFFILFMMFGFGCDNPTSPSKNDINEDASLGVNKTVKEYQTKNAGEDKSISKFYFFHNGASRKDMEDSLKAHDVVYSTGDISKVLDLSTVRSCSRGSLILIPLLKIDGVRFKNIHVVFYSDTLVLVKILEETLSTALSSPISELEVSYVDKYGSGSMTSEPERNKYLLRKYENPGEEVTVEFESYTRGGSGKDVREDTKPSKQDKVIYSYTIFFKGYKGMRKCAEDGRKNKKTGLTDKI